MDNKLKELIFNKLYRRLGNAEIIPYNNSIWFIDREKEYWYFEFDTSGTLWWRYHFFTSFFEMFSMDRNEFAPILSSWVEEVLNHKVSTTARNPASCNCEVEEVLNHKVTTTNLHTTPVPGKVEEVLNHKVSTTQFDNSRGIVRVEEALNYKVSTTKNSERLNLIRVENALKYKVSTTPKQLFVKSEQMEQVLNHKVTETQTGNAPPLSFVKDVLNNN